MALVQLRAARTLHSNCCVQYSNLWKACPLRDVCHTAAPNGQTLFEFYIFTVTDLPLESYRLGQGDSPTETVRQQVYRTAGDHCQEQIFLGSTL